MKKQSKTQQSQSAAILVLGDLNRSPRMLNHSKAISEVMQEINEVSLIGFNGGELRSDISTDRKIKLYYIPEKINNYLKKLPRFLFLVSAFIRIFLQVFFLFYILMFKIPRPKFLILQNPPGIPAMYICAVVCFMRRSTLIIDWHNYGYTILQVNGRNKFITYIAKLYEKIYGRCANLHFCVSEAMKTHLKYEMGIDAINLPDRAMKNVFRRLSLRESHELFEKYNETKGSITEMDDVDKVIRYKENRHILMISSTSWTPDEDFNLLLDSFILCEKKLSKEKDFKKVNKVLFIITGRGPSRDAFMKKVQNTNLQFFTVKSIWLESDDYPKILGAADLGVCLHYSSSGFDLPMKVVDMFSAQLPVAAFNYDTVHELVQEGDNGFLFKTKEQLSDILEKVIIDYSINDNSEDVEKFRQNLKDFNQNDWITQWQKVAYEPIAKKAKIKLHGE
jgi:beta-1,4-mannosyltransferase